MLGLDRPPWPCSELLYVTSSWHRTPRPPPPWHRLPQDLTTDTTASWVGSSPRHPRAGRNPSSAASRARSCRAEPGREEDLATEVQREKDTRPSKTLPTRSSGLGWPAWRAPRSILVNHMGTSTTVIDPSPADTGPPSTCLLWTPSWIPSSPGRTSTSNTSTNQMDTHRAGPGRSLPSQVSPPRERRSLGSGKVPPLLVQRVGR